MSLPLPVLTTTTTAEPSLWVKSSWRGDDQTLDHVCRVAVQKDLGDYLGTVGLFVVYGSWNHTRSKNKNAAPNTNGLLELFDTLLHPHARLDTNYSTGTIQVDASDEELNFCCGDGDTNNNNDETSKLPCPPGQLPVLLLVLRRSSMKEPEIRYLTDMAPKQILKHWKDPTAVDVSEEEKLEVQQALESFGLVPATIPPQLEAAAANINNNIHNPKSQALRIFVAGDRMSVGKTSVCLGLLGNLVAKGFPCESLAYIKPATQNESPQLVQKYCERMGIPCMPIGPIVYYRGFTRAFLAGDTETSDEMLLKVEAAVDQLALGKRVVIIDGVGFPAVGSICGTDNASVARASGYPPPSPHIIEEEEEEVVGQRRPPGVVLVGGSGVGGAVDAFNLNAAYLERAKVPVLGAIFNKLQLEGFYSLANCREQITSYFAQSEQQISLDRQAFGFVPLHPGIAGGKGKDSSSAKQIMDHALDYIRVFGAHVDMNALLEAAAKVQDQSFPIEMDIDDNGDNNIAATMASRPTKRVKTAEKRTRTRDEIETVAIQRGAAPSA